MFARLLRARCNVNIALGVDAATTAMLTALSVKNFIHLLGFCLNVQAQSGASKSLRFLGRCLVVGRTKDAIRAGTAQTPPLCRRDYTINDISTCVRSSGNCSVCSVRPTPKAQLQNSRVGLPKWPGSKTDLAIQAENRHSSWGLG